MILIICFTVLFAATLVRLKSKRSISVCLEAIGSLLLLLGAIAVTGFPHWFLLDKQPISSVGGAPVVVHVNLVAVRIRDTVIGIGLACFVAGYRDRKSVV